MTVELEESIATLNRVVANYRICCNVMQDVMTAKHQEEIKNLEKKVCILNQLEGSEYRIVEQRFQFTEWNTWSCKEQMENSLATDKTTATSGNCCIPNYCFLTLKEK